MPTHPPRRFAFSPGRIRSRAFQHLARGLLGLSALIVWGVTGFMYAGWSASDSLYMVLITISSVGYGEVRPVDTPYLRGHTMLLIAMGVLVAGYAVAGVLRIVTEDELARLTGHHRVRRMIESLSGHTIVAGFGRMGAMICEELAAAGEPFVLIDTSGDKLASLHQRGWLHVTGDATDEAVLASAGLAKARALVTSIPNDAANVFITLTARQMNGDVTIVARAELASTQKKLRQAGADHVVLPAAIGAHRIVSILTNPSAVEFIELVTHRSSLAIEMAEITVQEAGDFAGKTIREADIGRRTGVIVMAVKRMDGRVEFPPNGDEPLAVGDTVVLLGRHTNLDGLRREYRV